MKKNLAILPMLVGVLLLGGNNLHAQDVPGPQSIKRDGVRRSPTANDDLRLLSVPDIQSLTKDLKSQQMMANLLFG